MRTMRFILLFTLLLSQVAGAEEALPTLDVTPGRVQAFQAAVQRFADRTPTPDLARAEDFRAAIQDGLLFSGVFVVMTPAAFLGPEETVSLDDARPDCNAWKQGGTDALVEGTIEADGSQLAVEFRVWDVARCRELVRQRYRHAHSGFERLGTQVADDVVASFTGTRGAAATEIAFVSNRTGNKEIFVMDALGERQRPATRSLAIKAFPDWMPSGEAIVYTTYETDVPSLFLTSRGSGIRPGPILKRLEPGVPKYRGVFDPEGDTMALVMSVDGATEIFTVRRNGKKLRRLTENRAIDVAPTWSPDGKQIAFVSDRGGSPQIYVMNRDGSGQRRLTFQGSYNTAPAWSPDGRFIAYATRLEAQFDIWLIDPAGEVNFPLVEHPRSDESPSWSPDSRMLAFSSTRRGRADVYVIDVAGENLRRLTRGAGHNTSPAWGPFTR